MINTNEMIQNVINECKKQNEYEDKKSIEIFGKTFDELSYDEQEELYCYIY